MKKCRLFSTILSISISLVSFARADVGARGQWAYMGADESTVKLSPKEITVSFLANTAGVPDTLWETSTVQMRGNWPFTWGSDSPVFMYPIGGDYWRADVVIPYDSLNRVFEYKFCTFPVPPGELTGEMNGWEAGTNRTLDLRTFAGADTVLPLQYVRGWKDHADQFEAPFALTDSIDVFLRVNMELPIKSGLFNPINEFVGVRGSNAWASWAGTPDFNWETTYRFTRETSHVMGLWGSMYNGTYFYNGVLHLPRDWAGREIQYKFIIGDDWSRTDKSNRSFILPTDTSDVTVHWVWFNDDPPNRDLPIFAIDCYFYDYNCGYVPLKFGAALSATDSFDTRFDQIAPEMNIDSLDAYFEVGNNKYSHDFRNPSKEMVVWKIKYRLKQVTDRAYFTWNTGQLPSEGLIRLKSPGGFIDIDMRTVNQVEILKNWGISSLYIVYSKHDISALGEYNIKISVTNNIINDKTNYCGVGFDLHKGFDAGIDIPEPPVPLNNYLQLFFPHPEWGLPFVNFSTDIRTPVDLLYNNLIWDFVVATDQINQPHTISVAPQSGIDYSTPIYLKNLTTGEFFRLTTEHTTHTFTPTTAGNYPFQLIVGRLHPVQTISHTFSPGWIMFGLPMSPLNRSVDNLFRDDLVGDGYFFQYNGATGYSACDSLQTGAGYWLGLMNPGTLRFTGDSLNSAVSVALPYRNNIIGNPYKYPISKANFSFVRQGSSKTFTEAVSAGWISGALHGWQNTGTGSYLATDTLGVWQGAWLYPLLDDVTLQINPTPTDKSLAGSDTKLTGENWEVCLQLSSTWGGDLSSHIGVNTTATNGFDPAFDYPEPPTPPAGKHLTGYFEHADWSVLGPRYDRDIRATNASDYIWNYTVKSALNGAVTITWETVNLPSNYTLILHDPVQNRDINFRTQNSYTFNYTGVITFEIRRENYTGNADDKHGLPTEFVLLQNYPNPFNPITKIRYQLPKAANVHLKVYNLKGECVLTLVEAHQPPDYYTVELDARTLSSGVYFYRLEAGEFSSLRKCILLK